MDVNSDHHSHSLLVREARPTVDNITDGNIKPSSSLNVTESYAQIMEKVIERAKEAVELAYESRHSQRDWLDTFLDSYNSKTWRVRVLVLEGSPAKGYIVANYGTGSVQAYDGVDKQIATYSAEKMMLKLG